MLSSRNRFMLLLAVICFAGYSYLGYTLIQQDQHGNEVIGYCPMKHLTHIPCPSCGSTRSVISLVNGDITTSFLINPFGMLIAGIMIVVPFWILYDVANRKNSLLHAYKQMEIYLRKPFIAFPLIAAVIANWIWNISKGL